MKNKLLILGIVLIGIGLYNSDFISLPNWNNNQVCDTIEIAEPNEDLRKLVAPVVESLQNGDADRREDGVRLAKLYNDMAMLIMADDQILKTTGAIREANVLSAKILQIDVRGKYEGLAEAAENLFKEYVSTDSVPLDDDLRQKSSEAFLALAWGFLEGSK